MYIQLCSPDVMHLFLVQDLYSEDRRVWNAIFHMVSKDLCEAETNGICVAEEGNRFYPIILGNKGDWSYLVTWLLLYTTFLVSFPI